MLNVCTSFSKDLTKKVFFTVGEVALNRGISPLSRKFSSINQAFLSQESFPQSRKFSTIKEQQIFLQASKYFKSMQYLKFQAKIF